MQYRTFIWNQLHQGYIHPIVGVRHQSRIILPQHVSVELLICMIDAPRLRTRHLPDNIKVERTDRSHRLSLQLLYAEALEQR